MAEWYRKIKKGLPQTSIFKKESEEGAWKKCPKCKLKSKEDDLKVKLFVCNCGYHYRIGSTVYFDFLFDDAAYKTLYHDLTIEKDDIFTDIITYGERLKNAREKSGTNESISIAKGKISGIDVIIGAMDFTFIGGTMGSVMGEKISLAIDECILSRSPLVLILRTGGARMMESALALMQMTRLSAKLLQLSDASIPCISVLTDPTLGGVTASIGMKADLVVAEPNALIGYSAPRIIKESTGRDLPKGFQRSQFLMDHGFLDIIADREELKKTIYQFSRFIFEQSL